MSEKHLESDLALLKDNAIKTEDPGLDPKERYEILLKHLRDLSLSQDAAAAVIKSQQVTHEMYEWIEDYHTLCEYRNELEAAYFHYKNENKAD